MNTKEFIANIAAEAGLTKRDAKKFLRAFEYVLSEAIMREESVMIRDFGTFEPLVTAPRNVMNPYTKEIMTIDSKLKVVLKNGKGLECKLNDHIQF